MWKLEGNFELILIFLRRRINTSKYSANLEKICRNFGGQENCGIDFINLGRNFREKLFGSYSKNCKENIRKIIVGKFGEILRKHKY